jgi:hypothetical protein
MANTRRDLVSDGSTTVYDVAFDLGFISKDHVFVYLDDDNYTNQLQYTWVSDTQVELNVALPMGTVFSIRRVVPRNEPVNNYSDGAILREKELDNSFLQSLMIGEEQEDGYSNAYLIWQGDVDAQGHKLSNLPIPTTSNEPTLKVETDELAFRQTTTEVGLVNTNERVSSLESRSVAIEGTNTAQDIRIQTLESLVPSNLVSNVNYTTIDEVLGDKYKLGSIFDNMDAYDAALGAVYIGIATTEEVELVSKINEQLGVRLNG